MIGPLGFVVIGRNEGERLAACLQSLPEGSPVVYVDSGSTDGSPDRARGLGAEVVELTTDKPFSAARGRNEGFACLIEHNPGLEYVHFIDGDCTLAEGWVEKAWAALHEASDIAAVCGQRRERFPDANILHSLAEREWNTPVGVAESCGGDVLFRREAFEQGGGYNPGLIAGEEPELCVRVREKGWRIMRIDADMTWHDIALQSLKPFWTRAARAGHAFAEVSDLHKASPKRIWAKETKRALLWASFVPGLIVLALIISPIFLLGLLIYPLQVLRVGRSLGGKDAYAHAALYVFGRFPEAWGVLRYWRKRLTGRPNAVMDYKS